MKKTVINSYSYSGMMRTSEFKQWYTYFKKRLYHNFSASDLSFLLGKPDYYYADFEKMYKVSVFLSNEKMLLDKIYNCIEVEKMEFDLEDWEISEERLVRLDIQEDRFIKNYKICTPWKLKKSKEEIQPQLAFEEWPNEQDLQEEYDAQVHAKIECNRLMQVGMLKEAISPYDLFNQIKPTAGSKLKFYPTQLKNTLFQLIQQGKIGIKKYSDRIHFYQLRQ